MYEVLIAGAGPAGSSAAIMLAQAGARVALIEQSRFPRPKLCGEFISPECLRHFERLGVLSEIELSGGRQLHRTVFYSQNGQNISVPSRWFDEGRSALGLSRAQMDHVLLQRAERSGVEVFQEATVTRLIYNANGGITGVWCRQHGAEFELKAPITIDATGRSRKLARQIESQNEVRPSRARVVAFKAHFSNTGVAQGTCEIYSYRGGYGGLNVVEKGLSNLCFIADARDVRALGSEPAEVMKKIVMSNARAAETLAGARVETEWLSVALDHFGSRSAVPAQGLLAAGDAASFIDPFTGSGILMALESGEMVASAIIGGLDHLHDGVESILTSYRRRYEQRFRPRLRVSSLIRRAAYAPVAASAVIRAASVSEVVLRGLARKTRQGKEVSGLGSGVSKRRSGRKQQVKVTRC